MNTPLLVSVGVILAAAAGVGAVAFAGLQLDRRIEVLVVRRDRTLTVAVTPEESVH